MSLCLNNLMSLRDACSPFWMAKQAALSLRGRETHQTGVLKDLVNILRRGMLAFCKLVNIRLLTQYIKKTNLTAYTPLVVLPSACAFHRTTMLIPLQGAHPCRFYPLRSQHARPFTRSNFLWETHTAPMISPLVASQIWPAQTLPLLCHEE